ncbi:MAG: hypothetical protein KGH59_00030 [Candidatus Micrarchaeota archaeon]|nr:hypothetical protein [Candidatus Micrarchaeota archaeon]MDE1846731.1 hypothetical protein [Candidatus Micrarchaeota archaeon]
MTEKRVSIKLLGDAKEAYLALKRIVEEERKNGVESSFNQTLFRSIEDKIAILKRDYDFGIHIPKDRLGRKYIVEYDVTNLWKVNLSGGWRMIYTLKQPQRENTEVEILSIWLDVLDIIDHERYDKIFGYRKG